MSENRCPRCDRLLERLEEYRERTDEEVRANPYLTRDIMRVAKARCCEPCQFEGLALEWPDNDAPSVPTR